MNDLYISIIILYLAILIAKYLTKGQVSYKFGYHTCPTDLFLLYLLYNYPLVHLFCEFRKLSNRYNHNYLHMQICFVNCFATCTERCRICKKKKEEILLSYSVLWQNPYTQRKIKRNVTKQKRHQTVRLHNDCGPTKDGQLK